MSGSLLIDFSNVEVEQDVCNKCNKKQDIIINDICNNCEQLIKLQNNPIIEDIFALPYSEDKRQLIDQNIHQIFAIYCRMNKINYIILNNNKYKMLKNMCMNQTPEKIKHIFNTLFPYPCMIKAKHATNFLTEVVDLAPEKERYKYFHVVGPRVLDPWNVTYPNGVYCCYYKHGSNGTLPDKCPLLMKYIFKQWDNKQVIKLAEVKSEYGYYLKCINNNQ